MFIMTGDLTKRWISVLILCFINLINYMDRYTVAGVLGEIGKWWNLDDTQKGLIQTSFIICYFASAPVFGFLGDRHSRKWLMFFGVLAWGACTLASSFTKECDTYVPFLFLRAAIGFGEAGFTSIAPTVLGDLFKDGKRTIVLALFYFAIPVGSGLGYVVGSQVFYATDDWSWGLRITPFLNILALIALVFLLMDPPRGEHEQIEEKPWEKKGTTFGDQMRSWGTDLMYLLKNKSYMLSTIGFTCLTFCTGALSWFGPLFLENALDVRDEHHLEGYEDDIEKDDVGFIFGAILSAAGICGLILGSGLSFWLRKRLPWIDPVICGLGLLVSTPLIFVALYVLDTSVNTTFVLMFLGQIFLNMNWAVVVDISLYVVVPLKRSSAEAFQLMASHALGEAGSPYLTGVISDAFGSSLQGKMSHYNSSAEMSSQEIDFHSRQYALYFALAFEVMAAFFFLLTTIYVVSDRQKAEEAEKLAAASNGTVSTNYKENDDRQKVAAS